MKRFIDTTHRTFVEQPMIFGLCHSRKLPSIAVLSAVTIFAAVGLLPLEAQAACKGGFCVTGRDEGGKHIVDFTTTWTHIDHFNVSKPQVQQYELGVNERQFSFFNLPSGTVENFALQACSGGSLLSSSKCTPWAYFTHTAP